MKTSLAFVASLASLAAGCMADYPHDQLVTQAVYDLRCPAEQITFTDLGGQNIPFGHMRMVQGVSGCGKRTSYVYAPHSMAWIKNSAETNDAPAPALPPPPAAPPTITPAPQ